MSEIGSDNKKNKIKIFESKKLVYLEEFFDVLYDAHCIKRMHQGVTKSSNIYKSNILEFPSAP